MTREEAIASLQEAKLWEGASEHKPQPADYKGVGYTMAERSLDWLIDHADEIGYGR